MRKLVATFLLVFVLLIWASCKDKPRLTVVHPILNMEVVKIPGETKVISISGDAELKKHQIKDYRKVGIGTIVGEDDILWVKKGRITRIEFDDGSFIINDQPEKDVFIIFEVIKTINRPK
jgi:hypothetical protein